MFDPLTVCEYLYIFFSNLYTGVTNLVYVCQSFLSMNTVSQLYIFYIIGVLGDGIEFYFLRGVFHSLTNGYVEC